MNVLVTGASGWVGTAVTETVSKHHRVRALDLRSPQPTGEADFGGEVISGSIADFATVRSAVEGQDAIIHAALAYPGPDVEHSDPSESLPFEVNVKGTYNLLESARQEGVGRFILIAAAEDRVDHPPGTFVDRSTPYDGIGRIYDLIKRLQEEECRWFVRCHGLNIMVLRLGNVVDVNLGRLRPGEARWNTVMAGDGWVHRYDVGQACVRALEVEHKGWDVFHLISSPLAKRRFDTARAESVLGINFTTDFCRWSTIMSVVNRSGKMSVHERIDIDPERTGKAPSAQRYPGRSDISG